MEGKSKKNINELLGITFIRKFNKLTLAQMSDEIGVSKQTISKYESGKLKPSNEVLDMLVKKYGQTKEFYTKSLEKLDVIKFEKEELEKKIKKESEELEPEEQIVIDENGEEKTIIVKPVDAQKIKNYKDMAKEIRNLEVAAKLEKSFNLCRVKVEGKERAYRFKESMENMENYLQAEEKFVDLITNNKIDRVKLLRGLELLHKALINENTDNSPLIKMIMEELNKENDV